MSVKNGAELLDRLIKDIVSESAASYVSILDCASEITSAHVEPNESEPSQPPMAFSLQRFIPLLKERIWVINPFTRQFLVGWIALLDSIPDLELVTYLPAFLGGILKFLGDQNIDVRSATQACLDKFLNEIKRIARVQKGLTENKKNREGVKRKRQDSLDSASGNDDMEEGEEIDSNAVDHDGDDTDDDYWIPGQDVNLNYREILQILTGSLDSHLGLKNQLISR